MNAIASFRKCTLSNEELLKLVDEQIDELYKSGKIPDRFVPARPNKDFDLLVGELILRFSDSVKQERINVTSEVLDKLGFGEYWDEHGDWGYRPLTFKDGTIFRLAEYNEVDDDSYGMAEGGRYVPNHYFFQGGFQSPEKKSNCKIYFLHELYQLIKKEYPDSANEFLDKCKALKMDYAL